MNKKIIKMLLSWTIVGVIALTGCGGQAKEIAGEAVPEAATPVESTGNVGEADGITTASGVAAGENATEMTTVGGETVSEGAGDDVDILPIVVKKPDEIKTLSDFKSLNNGNALYPWVEKLLAERPISDYDEHFNEMTFVGSFDGGNFYRPATDEVLYAFPNIDYDAVSPPEKLNGNEVCSAIYLQLDKLYPNTEWPKNADGVREILGIDMDYETDYGNYLVATFAEIGLNIMINADVNGFVPGDYAVTLYNKKLTEGL